MAEDPAELARARRRRIEILVEQAEQWEREALARPGPAQEETTIANNLRLQALCEHFNLRPKGTDGDEG